MEYQFVPMNQEYAEEVLSWHYDGIYAFYDLAADEEDRQEFFDIANWDRIFAVVNVAEEMVGFYAYQFEDGVMWVGFGLKPELTGRGLGGEFVDKGLQFGVQYFNYQGERIMLAVATFNHRAIRLYEKLGFEHVENYIENTNGSEYEFFKMQKPTPWFLPLKSSGTEPT